MHTFFLFLPLLHIQNHKHKSDTSAFLFSRFTLDFVWLLLKFIQKSFWRANAVIIQKENRKLWWWIMNTERWGTLNPNHRRKTERQKESLYRWWWICRCAQQENHIYLLFEFERVRKQKQRKSFQVNDRFGSLKSLSILHALSLEYDFGLFIGTVNGSFDCFCFSSFSWH